MKKLLLLLTCTLLLFGCAEKQRHYKEKVQCYKTHSVDGSGNDVWLYYYLFMGSNNYYYYNSTTPVTDFSNASWQTSTTSPVNTADAQNVEQMPEQVVSTQEMPADIQQEMESNPENFGGMTADEMGDYEGGGSSSGTSEGNSASDNSSDAGSDSGSDSGGGDSGAGGE